MLQNALFSSLILGVNGNISHTFCNAAGMILYGKIISEKILVLKWGLIIIFSGKVINSVLE